MKKRKEKLVELTIESIGFQGKAVARKEGLVHFVRGAVPGDKIIAKIHKKKKNYIEASVKEFIELSDKRVKPECKHFDICGGCSWQNLDYIEQLYWKRQHVQDAFERIGNLKDISYADTIASANIFHYRNKMEFSFGASRWVTSEEIGRDDIIENKDFALGLHIPGRYDKVIDIDECMIQNNLGNSLLKIIRTKAIQTSVTAYNSRTHEGFLRNLILRYSRANDELMLILVTNDIKSDEDAEMINWLDNYLIIEFPQINEIFHVINNTISPVSYGDIKILKGNGYITEQILGLDYRISPFSFFQTNPWQLDSFISKIIDMADIKGYETVWDLYCGTGSITLPASLKCAEIFGIEIVESSIDDAKQNASLNNITNANFICGDLHSKSSFELFMGLPKPDIVFIDPPRAGIHKNLIQHINTINAEKIVYVSCNPTTQARDCELLSERYKVISIVPVDMFPHTFHVESIALLQRL